MLTIHYTADRAALIDNAATQADRDPIIASYDDYIAFLESHDVTIDYDNQGTTLCWSGVDEWPADLPDFWQWLN